MSYGPVKQLESVPEEPEEEIGDGSETDIELAKADNCTSPVDETLSFLGGKRKGAGGIQNSNPARVLARRGAGYCLHAMCSVMPWIINMILAVLVVVLALKLNSEARGSHLPPTDMMYSKWAFGSGSLCERCEKRLESG